MSDLLPKPIAATWARSTLISTVTAAFMVLGVVLSGPASAAPQPGSGEITGTITDAVTGAPVADAGVEIYRVVPGGLEWYDAVPADSAGTYSADLPPGTYRVCAGSSWWEPQTHVPTCFGGETAGQADDVEVVEGEVDVVSIALEPMATISGTVTRPDGTPLQGIAVTSQVFFAPHNHFHWTDYATTDAEGTYTVSAEVGSTILGFSSSNGEYAAEYWNDQPSEWTANEITVSAGQAITGKDAVLTRTAGIGGTVTLPAGALRGDKRVRIIDPETGVVAARAAVAADGTYTAWGLEAGTYRVEFARVSGAAIAAAEFWDGAAEGTPGAADLITLGAHQLRDDVNATLTVGGTVSGRLIDTHGNPLIGCQVVAYSADGGLISRSDQTDSNGDFAVTGLSAGPRLVQVNGWDGDCDGGTQFYDGDQVLATDGSAADGVTASLGGSNALGTLTYARGAAISGTLTAPEGALSGDRRVRLVDAASGDRVQSVRADADGNWSFEGLEAGSYRLEFSRISGQAIAAAEFYDDIAEQLGTGDARVFQVGLGDVESGVNAALALGGTITGVLHNSHGATLPYCYVQAYTADGQLVTRGAYTDETGEFSVGGLSTGDYLLKVDAGNSESCDGGDQYAVGNGGAMSLTEDTAVPFSVTRGESTALATPLVYTRGGVVEGTVELPEGATRIDRSVQLIDAETGEIARYSNSWRESPTAGNTFTYMMSGLPTGSYKLAFGRLSGMALSAATFYNGVAQGEGFASGATIDVVAGDTTSVDAATGPLGSSVSGKVVNADGAGILGCVVQAFTADGLLVTRTDRTDETGAFTVPGLSAGDYLLRVAPGGGCRGGLQYLQSGTGVLSGQFPAADPVTVPASGNTEITPDLVYAEGVSISGTITVPAALTDSWVPVRLVDVATGEVVGGTWVGESMPYMFRDLAASTYRVEIARDSMTTLVAAAFYDNVDEGAGADNADEITLQPGEDLGGVDQTLKVGGTLEATLVDGAGNPEESCSLTAYRPDGSLSSRNGFTMAGGEIWLKGLTTGDYRLAVECGGVTRYYTGGSHLSLDEADGTTFHATQGEPLTISDPLVFGDAPVPSVENTGLPTVSDTTPQVGQTLTATAGTWSPTPDSTTFQWFADGEPIDGATDATYAVVAGDEGTALTVEVTASKDGHTPASATSTPTEAVVPAAEPETLENVTVPTIDDTTPKVGQTLTAAGGTWSETPDSVTFQWFANGGPIAGATGATLELTGSEAFQEITVRAVAHKSGFVDATATSAATEQVVAGEFTNTAPASVLGAPAAGQTLTAHPGGWSPEPAGYLYGWIVGGVPVDGATGSTFVVPASAQGRSIQVFVAATRPGYVTGYSMSAPVTIPAAAPPASFAFGGEPRITGINRARRILSYVAPAVSPAPMVVSYQWLRNGTPIATATNRRYRVRYKDRRKVVSLRVTYALPGYPTVVKVTNGKRIR